MKSLIVLLSFFLVFSCNKDSKSLLNAPEIEHPFLLNKVYADSQLVEEFIYNENNQVVMFKKFYNDSCISTEYYKFDSNGNLIERKYNGFIENYYYDEYGRLIILLNFYAKTNKRWKTKYNYNNSQRIQEGRTFFNDNLTGYINYQYDDIGNTIEKNVFQIDNTLSYECKLKFDTYSNPYPINFPLDVAKNGNVLKSYEYNIVMSSFPPEFQSSFEYDSYGLPIKEIRTSLNSHKSMIYEYIYIDRK